MMLGAELIKSVAVEEDRVLRPTQRCDLRNTGAAVALASADPLRFG